MLPDAQGFGDFGCWCSGVEYLAGRPQRGCGRFRRLFGVGQVGIPVNVPETANRVGKGNPRGSRFSEHFGACVLWACPGVPKGTGYGT